MDDASAPAAKRAKAAPTGGREGGVLVLDFGSQYTQLITRRVRELGVYSALLPGDAEQVLLAPSPHLPRTCPASPRALVPPRRHDSEPESGRPVGGGTRRDDERAVRRVGTWRTERGCGTCGRMRMRGRQARVEGLKPDVIILSGGPNSVHVDGAPTVRSRRRLPAKHARDFSMHPYHTPRRREHHLAIAAREACARPLSAARTHRVDAEQFAVDDGPSTHRPLASPQGCGCLWAQSRRPGSVPATR